MAASNGGGGIRRIALIGNSPPRLCGIATFTADIRDALTGAFPDVAIDVYAMNDGGRRYDYGGDVVCAIDQDNIADYQLAAQRINDSAADVVLVQHEYGIFGGSAGSLLLRLLDRVEAPVVVTLHTVLENPDPDQRSVIEALARRAAKLIVMAEKGREILERVHGLAASRIAVIPHGVPDRPLSDTEAMKARFGFEGRDVLLTFGLLSPNKGIETMIRALPAIVENNRQALYVVLGATHPHLVAREGEAYRESLMALARELGVADHVRFIDGFLQQERLLDYLEAADIYVTPYLNEAQITSGTLSYAVALGKPVVSTPYWHAVELLAEDVGVLAGFGDSAAFAAAINGLLADRERMEAIRNRAWGIGRGMLWERLAEAYMAMFTAARTTKPVRLRRTVVERQEALAPRLDAIERLTDDCGMLQHSIYTVPDRTHGYCVDDNCRALMLMHRMDGDLAERADALATVYASFVQYAWNGAIGRFRNFMGFERNWLEAEGSQDSFGRSLWSIGVTAAEARPQELRRWALHLFDQVAPNALTLVAPRSWAFAMLGADALLSAHPGHAISRTLLTELGGRLRALLAGARREGWYWFEPTLAYDNARLPEALIRAGRRLGDEAMAAEGLAALDWLDGVQTNRQGQFRAVGTDSFGRTYASPLPFDQQPLEAWATIEAAMAAHDATGLTRWQEAAWRAYRWYLGDNDLGVPIASTDGGCFDGLMSDRANLNQGAESVLSFQFACCAMARMAGRGRVEFGHGGLTESRRGKKLFDVIHCPLRLQADPARVVVRPFHIPIENHPVPGLPGRVRRIATAVLEMDLETAEAQLELVLRDFEARHWQTRNVFLQRYAVIEAALQLDGASIPEVKRQLIGAYFCHEYSYAAAALMNPSIIPHPDQSGLSQGAVRIAMSLRAVGEGHISSVAWREGIVGPGPVFELMPEPPFATAADTAIELGNGAIEVHRHRDSSLSGTVLFPMTEAQRNGLEDLRMVEFMHPDGTVEWIGTYTAYSGSTIRSELLRTRDFRTFVLAPMSGPAARNKGMALFPRKIGGQYMMIGRQDGENVYLLKSKRIDQWGEGELLITPEYPWEMVQIGNCGSPIELEEGWLLLTHGVGAMRKYSIGAVLLDKKDPSKIIGKMAQPLLSAADEDREGYVPNVVYTCGALKHGELIFIPYGVADSSVAFAFVPIAAILAEMR